MIANVFEVLARELDTYFKAAPSRTFSNDINPVIPGKAPGADNDPVVQIVGFLEQEDQQEFIRFPMNRVTPILINMEEEGHLRPSDRYSRISTNGAREPVFPDVRLNLYVLFVSHFLDYTDALYYLGLTVRYFQAHPVLNHKDVPEMLPEIDKLIVELVTLPFNEQNEVWNALRSAYHPSVLYRVKMVVFQDQPSVLGAGEIKEINIDTDDL